MRKSSRGNPYHDERGRFCSANKANCVSEKTAEEYAERTQERIAVIDTDTGETIATAVVGNGSIHIHEFKDGETPPFGEWIDTDIENGIKRVYYQEKGEDGRTRCYFQHYEKYGDKYRAPFGPEEIPREDYKEEKELTLKYAKDDLGKAWVNGDVTKATQAFNDMPVGTVVRGTWQGKPGIYEKRVDGKWTVLQTGDGNTITSGQLGHNIANSRGMLGKSDNLQVFPREDRLSTINGERIVGTLYDTVEGKYTETEMEEVIMSSPYKSWTQYAKYKGYNIVEVTEKGNLYMRNGLDHFQVDDTGLSI